MNIVSRDYLKKEIDRGNLSFHLIDVLDSQNYANHHLPHAINIPYKDKKFLENIKSVIPKKTDKIIVYSADEDCKLSHDAYRKLERDGYTNVFRYKLGKKDWRASGLFVEKSESKKTG